jgi:hypothetical protein
MKPARTRKLLWVAAWLAAAACACSPVTPPVRPAASAPAPQFSLALVEVEVGGAHRLAAQFTNTGATAQTVVRPGDGSDVGWRPPHITWIVETLDGAPVQLGGVGRCGNFNALTSADFVELAPAQSESFADWLHPPRVAVAGRYRVALEWNFDPQGEWGAGGFEGPEHGASLERLRKLPAFSVRSEFVEQELGGR